MNSSPIDKQHILKLIDFLYNEVISAGGDGDSLWYSRYYDINEIEKVLAEYNSQLKFPWQINLSGKTIQWGENQEWVIITNDEQVYLRSPDWQQCKIRY